MRFSIILSYDGSSFSGWQRQPCADSIQGTLENALSTLLRREIRVTGAGRTDAGVHAIGYVAHFDYDGPETTDVKNLSYKLNAILPRSITVHHIEREKAEFHARFDAVRREYTYFIHRPKDPFAERYSYQYGFPLDMDAMNAAAALLAGTHDFASFEKTGGSRKTTLCTVYEAAWHPYTPVHAELMHFPAAAEDYLYFRVAADRFLRNMVRALVGSLLEIGRGRRTPDWIETLLAARNRSAAGESVPARALFLSGVRYPPEAASAIFLT